MRFLHRWLAWLMGGVEEMMIARLLRQRDAAWHEADVARRALREAKP